MKISITATILSQFRKSEEGVLLRDIINVRKYDARTLKKCEKSFYHEIHIPALDSWKSQLEKRRINFTRV